MEDLNLLERAVLRQESKYFGKYRGFVADDKDPEKRARLKLTVPTVLGEATSNWALPCLPYGGANGIGFVAVPPVGAQVLVEFMEGDISTPLWTGTFWRTADEVPPEFQAAEPTAKMLKTLSGHVMVFEDKDGAETITFKSAKEAEVLMDEKGSIVLKDSKGANVTLDADAGELKIEDANGNSMTFSSSGFVLKDEPPDRLHAGIRIVAAGEALLAPTVTRRLIEEFVRRPAAGGWPVLGRAQHRQGPVTGPRHDQQAAAGG